MAELSLADAAKTVVFLHAPHPTIVGQVKVGSAFLVAAADRLMLVTAEHVVRDLVGQVTATFGDANDVPQHFPLTTLAGTALLNWIAHGVADVAVLELRPSPEVASLLSPRAVQTNHLIRGLEVPDRDRPLTMVGFPLGFGGLTFGPEGRVSPLSRESRPCSGLLMLPRADTQQPSVMYLLSDPSIGGYSGAPVFLLPAAFSSGGRLHLPSVGNAYCLGLVHGTWGDDTGGKMAAIVPVAHIVKTLEKALSGPPVEYATQLPNFGFSVDA